MPSPAAPSILGCPCHAGGSGCHPVQPPLLWVTGWGVPVPSRAAWPGWGPAQAAPGQVLSGCCRSRRHWRRARGPGAHRDTPAFQPASPGHSLLRLVPAQPSPWPSLSDTADGLQSEPPGTDFPGHNQPRVAAPRRQTGRGDNVPAARMPLAPVSPSPHFERDPAPVPLPRYLPACPAPSPAPSGSGCRRPQPLTCAQQQQQQKDRERHGARPGVPAPRGARRRLLLSR